MLYCNTTQPAQDTASQRAAQCLQYGQAGAQPAPTTRPLGPRYDWAAKPRHGRSAHDTARHARACVPSWASFGDRAPSLVFDLVFRLGIGSESPFGPGS